MICTLIKNDYILMEPSLLTSPPRERVRLRPEDVKWGRSICRAHQPAHSGARASEGLSGAVLRVCVEVELSSSFEHKNTRPCGWCSLSSPELGGSHQAPWILTHVLGTGLIVYTDPVSQHL